MASDMSDNMKPVADFYTRWSKDSLDMLSKGMTMYNKMSRGWMDVAEGSSGEKPDDMLKKWGDAFSGSYNDLFEMYMQPFKKFGGGQAPGKEAWEDAFAKWQKMFTSMPAGSAPTAAPEEFVNFSKNWFEGYAKVWQTWLESMQKMSDACKTSVGEAEKPGAAMSDVSEISDRFMKEWSAFVVGAGPILLCAVEVPAACGEKGAEESQEGIDPSGQRDPGLSFQSKIKKGLPAIGSPFSLIIWMSKIGNSILSIPRKRESRLDLLIFTGLR